MKICRLAVSYMECLDSARPRSLPNHLIIINGIRGSSGSRPPRSKNLLLAESNTNAINANQLTTNKAGEVVKCVGYLPLAVSHAALFMKETGKKLDNILILLQGEHRLRVCAITISFLSLFMFPGKMISWENNLSSYQQKSVAATFVFQLDDLDLQCPDASNFLKMLSSLDPGCIPLDIVVEGSEALSLSSSGAIATVSENVFSLFQETKDKRCDQVAQKRNQCLLSFSHLSSFRALSGNCRNGP
jgi:hypothetical protein